MVDVQQITLRFSYRYPCRYSYHSYYISKTIIDPDPASDRSIVVRGEIACEDDSLFYNVLWDWSELDE